jgi:hypothetical protein
MDQLNIQSPKPDDEISLKELILKIRSGFRYLLSRWKLLLLSGLIGAGLGFTYASFQKTNYSAELTFVLEEAGANQLSAYSGLASQFGIDLGGSSNSGIYTEDNIIGFLKSRLMIEKTLLSPISYQNKQTSLANAYIDIYGLREKWRKKKEALKNIQFPVNPVRKNFTLLQDSILNTIYTDILKKKLIVEKVDKKLSFISVKCATEDALFSKVFVEHLVNEATDFYVQTKTKRSKANVEKLQLKADSIEYLLNRKTYSVAAAQDLNMNPARSVANVGLEVGTRDKIVLQTMYGEVIKNLEISKMAMVQETPIIQTIDTPILPLEEKRAGRLKSLIIGGFAGAFAIALFLLIKKTYKEIII